MWHAARNGCFDMRIMLEALDAAARAGEHMMSGTGSMPAQACSNVCNPQPNYRRSGSSVRICQ